MDFNLEVRRPATFPGMELTFFKGRNRAFEPSFLTDYNFGVRLAGVRETRYRAQRFRSGPGTFLSYSPGVALAAKPVTHGAWSYLDVSISTAALATLLGTDAADLERTALAGVNPKRNDPLFSLFVQSYASLREDASRLEQETKLLAWLQPLLGSPLANIQRDRPEHRAVKLIKDYLHDQLAENVSLDDLSALVGLNKFHLLRVFQHATGITPYQYQTSARLAQAKNLLWQNLTAAEVAARVGLYDQSALTRLFKRHTFVTPGEYKALVKMKVARNDRS